jgi:RimJ/RimL family protein N-acetyltransferase
MQHKISAEKFGVRLRPADLDDAGLIVHLRNSQHALEFIGDSAKNVPEQEAWLKRYFERPNDYCFMIETTYNAKTVGMLGVYGIEGELGEWGRWVLEPGVPAAPASAWLALHVCFDVLGLKTVRGLVVETNKEVLSFHKRAGYELIGFHPEPRMIGGKQVRMVEFRTTSLEWPVMASSLGRYALMAQQFMEGCDA